MCEIDIVSGSCDFEGFIFRLLSGREHRFQKLRQSLFCSERRWKQKILDKNAINWAKLRIGKVAKTFEVRIQFCTGSSRCRRRHSLPKLPNIIRNNRSLYSSLQRLPILTTLFLVQSNTFQAVVIANGQYTFLKYLYPYGGIQWAVPAEL